MSNAELWDLDTSGGIMEQIQNLVAPPLSADGLRRSRRQQREHDVYRRPGRAVNHDCCDSCKEGGDLICCDKCPAAFHLLCHDPPLEEEDVPNGLWLCHKCRTEALEVKDDDAESTSSKSSVKSGRGKKLATPMEPERETEHPLRTLAKAARFMNPSQFDVGKEISCHKDLPGSSKRLYGKAAKNLPKKQAHELDNGLVPLPAKVCFSCNKSCRVAPLIQCDYCPLLFHLDCLNPPLTTVPQGRWMCPNHVEQYLDSQLLKSQSLTERLQLWDRYSGMVDSHTVKVDFLNKVHRKDPLFRLKRKLPSRPSIIVPPAIKHFYENPPALLPEPTRCPPPATLAHDLPGARGTYAATLDEQEEWLSSVVSMQSSVAKFMAQRQLQKHSVPKDPSSASQKPTASVAPVVQKDSEICFDGSPLSMLPNNPSELNKSLSSSSSTSSASSINDLQDCDNKFLLHKNSFQNGDLLHPNRGSDEYMNSSGFSKSGHTHSLLSNFNLGKKTSNNCVDLPTNGDVYPPDIEMMDSADHMPRGRSSSADSLPSPTGKTWGEKDHLTNNSKVGGSSNSLLSRRHVYHHKAASSVGSRSRGNTGYSNMREKQNSSSTNSALPAIQSLNQALQQWIAEGSDFELSKFDEKLTQLLAWQRLQQLLPTKSANNPLAHTSASVSSSIPPLSSSASSSAGKKGLLNTYLSQQSSAEVRARAVLCPLSGKGQAIPMPYRSLSLGTGADMDVCLSQFGQCGFISGHHATIFYDEMSRHFELLNYSEHGTTVDNVLYSCDFSDKPATTPQPSPIVAAVREIIAKGRPKGSKKKSKHAEAEKAEKIDLVEKPKMSAKAQDGRQPCNCRISSSSLIGGSGAGWEGTAVLHHGSAIKVGCLQFVFSIVDQAPDNNHTGSRKNRTVEFPSTTFSSQPQHPTTSISSSSSSSFTARISSIPLLSSSQYIHNQPNSILKAQLKSTDRP